MLMNRGNLLRNKIRLIYFDNDVFVVAPSSPIAGDLYFHKWVCSCLTLFWTFEKRPILGNRVHSTPSNPAQGEHLFDILLLHLENMHEARHGSCGLCHFGDIHKHLCLRCGVYPYGILLGTRCLACRPRDLDYLFLPDGKVHLAWVARPICHICYFLFIARSPKKGREHLRSSLPSFLCAYIANGDFEHHWTSHAHS